MSEEREEYLTQVTLEDGTTARVDPRTSPLAPGRHRHTLSPEVIALIESMLIAGAKPTQVNRMTGVSVTTVYEINHDLRQKVAGLYNYEEQVLHFLKAELNAITAQARVFADTDYLKSQPLPELVKLHNEQFRIAAHLLGSFAGSDESEDESQPVAGLIEHVGSVVDTESEEPAPEDGLSGADG